MEPCGTLHEVESDGKGTTTVWRAQCSARNCYGMDGSILLWVFAILRSCDKL